MPGVNDRHRTGHYGVVSLRTAFTELAGVEHPVAMLGFGDPGQFSEVVRQSGALLVVR
jgi:hypothetical protein